MSRFNADQMAAVQLRRNGVCAAGAGAGKTTVLTERFLTLLAREGVGVDQILTLTFTRKASQEMYERIYRQLSKRKDEHPAWMRGFLEFERGQISTLDSFCTQIVRSGAPRFGIPSSFTVDEGRLLSLVHQAVQGFLLRNGDDPVMHRWVQAFGVQGVIDQVLLPLGMELTVPGNLVSSVRTAAEEDLQGLETQLIGSIDSTAEQAREVRKLLEQGYEDLIAQTPAKAKKPPANLLENMDFLGQMEQWEGAVLFRDCLEPDFSWPEVPKPVTRRKEFPQSLLDGIAAYREIRDRYKALPGIIRVLRNRDDLIHVSGLLEDLRQEIVAQKRAQGILSFSDLTILSIAILQEDHELADFYRRRFRYIMIDEFQDNNDLQRRLLFLLAAEPGFSEDRIPRGDEIRQDVLFFVGDEKQSIYQFRGADVRVFKHLREELAGGQIILGTNYRSHPQLIRYFNTLFSRVFSHHPMMDPAYQAFEAEFRPIQSRPDTEQAPPGLLEFWLQPDYRSFPGPGSDSSDGADRQAEPLSPGETEALAVARRITRLIQEKTPVWDRDLQTLRPVRYEDIGILYKSGSRQMDLERMLRYHGIPYRLKQVRSLFLDALAHDFYAMLQLVVYPADTEAWAGASRSPFLNLSYQGLDELLEWVRAQKHIRPRQLLSQDNQHAAIPEFTQPADRHNWQSFQALYASLLDAADLQEPGTLGDILWIQGGYKGLVCSSPGNQVFLEHFDFFRAYLQAQADRPLAIILKDIRSNLGKFEKIDELPVLLPQARGVSIMSVHASKGLEFPVVILTNTGGGSMSDRAASQAGIVTRDGENRPRLLLNGGFTQGQAERNPHIEALARQKTFQDAAELRRLFYVACTRAEHHLFIFGTHNSQNKAGLTQEEYWSDQKNQNPRQPKTFLALLSWAYFARNEWPWDRLDTETPPEELIPQQYRFSDGLVFHRIDPVTREQWQRYRRDLSGFVSQGDSNALASRIRRWRTNPAVRTTTDIQQALRSSFPGDDPEDLRDTTLPTWTEASPAHSSSPGAGNTMDRQEDQQSWEGAQIVGSLSHWCIEVGIRTAVDSLGSLVNPGMSGDSFLQRTGFTYALPEEQDLIPRSLTRALQQSPDPEALWTEGLTLARNFFDGTFWQGLGRLSGVYLYPELPVLFADPGTGEDQSARRRVSQSQSTAPGTGGVSTVKGFVRGIIDVVVDLPDQRLVVDFKTDHHLVPEHYRVQLALYSQAARNLRLPGYPDRGGSRGLPGESVSLGARLISLRSGEVFPLD